MTDAIDPILQDPAVNMALCRLLKAMMDAAEWSGSELTSVAVVWSSAKGDYDNGWASMWGDRSVETVEFLADTLLENSEDRDPPPAIGLRH